jgi:hypothetical protein
MTTLQEFDKKAANYLDKLTTYVEGRVILEMLKPLIHQAVDEAYLAGKEDEKKRIVEMIRGLLKDTPDLDDPFYRTGGVFQKEQERQLEHLINSIRGYNHALSEIISLLGKG